ncbi:hypothetical protein M2169_002697 [Streptomyces sp. MJP52]|nr:hypothetical protein [Streptomyces sp. MJP52]
MPYARDRAAACAGGAGRSALFLPARFPGARVPRSGPSRAYVRAAPALPRSPSGDAPVRSGGTTARGVRDVAGLGAPPRAASRPEGAERGPGGQSDFSVNVACSGPDVAPLLATTRYVPDPALPFGAASHLSESLGLRSHSTS